MLAARRSRFRYVQLPVLGSCSVPFYLSLTSPSARYSRLVARLVSRWVIPHGYSRLVGRWVAIALPTHAMMYLR